MTTKIWSSHKLQGFIQITNETNVEEQPLEPERHFTKTLLIPSVRASGYNPETKQHFIQIVDVRKQ